MVVLEDGNIIKIEDNVVVNALKYQPTTINAVGERTITIGESTQISHIVEIHTTDYHGTYDNTDKRSNVDKNITIGNYVLIGLGSTI